MRYIEILTYFTYLLNLAMFPKHRSLPKFKFDSLSHSELLSSEVVMLLISETAEWWRWW